MSTIAYKVTAGDYGKVLTATLKSKDGPIDLSLADTVTFLVSKGCDTPIIDHRDCAIAGNQMTSTGVVHYTFQSPDLEAEPGDYEMWFVITWGTHVETVPTTDGPPDYMRILKKPGTL